MDTLNHGTESVAIDSEGLLFSRGRYYRDLLAATIFDVTFGVRYFRGRTFDSRNKMD